MSGKELIWNGDRHYIIHIFRCKKCGALFTQFDREIHLRECPEPEWELVHTYRVIAKDLNSACEAALSAYSGGVV